MYLKNFWFFRIWYELRKTMKKWVFFIQSETCFQPAFVLKTSIRVSFSLVKYLAEICYICWECNKRCQSTKTKKCKILAFTEMFHRVHVLIPLFSLVCMGNPKILERFLSIETIFFSRSFRVIRMAFICVLIKVLKCSSNVLWVFTYILTYLKL